MIRRPPRSTQSRSSAASDVYKRQVPDTRRGQIVIVFNPKGGVGKTTIAVNAASLLQIRKGQRVLLVDCDTVTGHVASSLGLENTRTVADAWTDEMDTGVAESFAEI